MAKKFFSIFVIALSLLVIQTSTSFAGEECGCQAMAMKMHDAVAKLDLTQEQKDKIKEVVSRTRDANNAKRDEMRDLRMLINSSFKDNTMTESKIDEFANKQMHVMGDIIKMRMMERFDISKTLTPEQKEKLNEMMHKIMEENAKEKGMCKGDKKKEEE